MQVFICVTILQMHALLTAACFDSVESVVLTAAKLFNHPALFPFSNVFGSSAHQTAVAPTSSSAVS